MTPNGNLPVHLRAQSLFPGLASSPSSGAPPRASQNSGTNGLDAMAAPAAVPANLKRSRGSSRDREGNLSLQKLLEQQNEILQQFQLGETANHKCSNVFALASRADPTLRNLFLEWHAEFKKDISHHANCLELAEKYSKVNNSGEVFKQFASEATRKWQFTKEYKNNARPAIGEETAQDPASYDIEKAWAEIRKKHALECQRFITAHNGLALQFYARRISYSHAWEVLQDQLKSFFVLHKDVYDQTTQQRMLKLGQQIVESAILHEAPKARARISKQQKETKKKESQQLEAETTFQQLEFRELLALYHLNKNKLSTLNASTPHPSKKPGNKHVNSDSFVGQLLKDSTHLDQLGIQITPAGLGHSARPTTKGATSSRTSRSSSVRSLPRSRSSSAKSWRSHYSRVSSRGRSSSRGKSIGNASKPSSNSRRRGQSAKGKGKGKDKGKRSSRGSSHAKSRKPRFSRQHSKPPRSTSQDRQPWRGRSKKTS